MIRHVLRGFSLDLKDYTDEAEDLNILLAWVTCAPRPLRLCELNAVLKITSPARGDRELLERDLRIKFASFFTLAQDKITTAVLQQASEAFINAFNAKGNTEFHSNPKTTGITFCHASIGDFFRNDQHPYARAEAGCPKVGSDFNSAKVSVLRTCLDILCSEESSEKRQWAINV
jgi:hypothetical protein